jgi:steroid delta-isomerase-like uncharacterized protein
MPEFPRDASVALVRDYYDAFNARDWDGMLALLAEDVIHDVNQGASRKGRAEFARFLERMDVCYEERLEDMVVMASDDGARAAAEFLVIGAYQSTDDGMPEATGQRYELPAGAFFTIADGKISRVSTHYNVKDWLVQVEG